MNSNQIERNECTNGRDDPNNRPPPTCPPKDGTLCYRDFSVVDEKHQNDASFWIEQGIAEKEPPFPAKLHAMLSNPRIQDIITWQPHGRSWRILNRKEFEEKVIPLYFTHNRYASFITQVNGYGFRRITSGIDSNTYFHELFLRGMPHLCKKMRRHRSKEIRDRKQKSEGNGPPDFYKLSRENPLPEIDVPATSISDGCERASSGVAGHSAPSMCVTKAPEETSQQVCQSGIPPNKALEMPSALSHLASRYQLSPNALLGTQLFTPNIIDVPASTNSNLPFCNLTHQDIVNLIAIASRARLAACPPQESNPSLGGGTFTIGLTSNNAVNPTTSILRLDTVPMGLAYDNTVSNNAVNATTSDLATLIAQSLLQNHMSSNIQNA